VKWYNQQVVWLRRISSENSSMDITELTQRMHDFVRAKGWYEPGSPRQQTPRNIAISICIEAAEVL